MRGSDPDATVYWLARMIEGGEDPRFIARRIFILASEDVGLADPRAITIAAAAFKSAESIGYPECRINLAEAAIYMALAPKSNATYLAIDASILMTTPMPRWSSSTFPMASNGDASTSRPASVGKSSASRQRSSLATCRRAVERRCKGARRKDREAGCREATVGVRRRACTYAKRILYAQKGTSRFASGIICAII